MAAMTEKARFASHRHSVEPVEVSLSDLRLEYIDQLSRYDEWHITGYYVSAAPTSCS